MRWICWIILQSASPAEEAPKFNTLTSGYLLVICSVVATNPTTYDWAFVIKQLVLESPAKRPTLATYRHIITHDKSTTITTCGWIVRCFLLFVGWKYIFQHNLWLSVRPHFYTKHIITNIFLQQQNWWLIQS